MSAIVVHHLENSRSLRILWLLEELGQDYEIREYTRNPVTMRAPDAMRKLHPLGKAPVVTVGDLALAESGAIIESLIERFDAESLRPSGDEEAEEAYRYWVHYAEGSLMPQLLVRLIFDQVRTAKLPFFVKPIAKTIVSKVDAAYTNPELARHFEFIEGRLKDAQYFAGEAFSAADIQMSYPIEVRALRGELDERFPSTRAWLDRVTARPAYARAVERGGANELPTRRES